MFGYKMVKNGLLMLYQDASGFAGWGKDLAGELIRVGEYSLALDEISYAYINNRESMPGNLFELFEKLAIAMDMEGDEIFKGVTQLRTEAKARLA